MHLDDSFNSFRHAPLHLPTRHQLAWTALTVACTTSVIASPDVRALMSILFKVAWLYMVAGAGG
jgi:hypothetical protein